MHTRLTLQTFLEELLGSRNVYFQPPSGKKMNYPAIVYSIDKVDNSFADDRVYLQSLGYKLTVISSNPEDEIFSKISRLMGCRFTGRFVNDNLNHHTYLLFY